MEKQAVQSARSVNMIINSEISEFLFDRECRVFCNKIIDILNDSKKQKAVIFIKKSVKVEFLECFFSYLSGRNVPLANKMISESEFEEYMEFMKLVNVLEHKNESFFYV